MADSKAKITISAEDKISEALDSARAKLEKFSAATASLTTIIGIGASAGIAASVRGIINLGDEMNDLSQKVGVGVKDLATWQLAANQSGTSIEAVAKGVKGLSKYMVENGDAMQKAGITAKDANGALIQLADLFKAMPDGVEKTALAVKLFGKSGMDMIPMLNQGSEGLAEAQEKARVYGERMALLAPLADKFNDQVAELALQSKAASINMALLVTGPMTAWLEQSNAAVRIAGSAAEAARLFVFNLDAMTSEKPREEITRLTKALKEFQEAGTVGKFVQSPTGVIFGGREEDLKKQIEFLKYLERQAAMEGAAKLGDYRDARDLRRDGRATMSQAETMAKFSTLYGKAATTAIAKPVGSVSDYAMRLNEAVAGAINSSAVVKARELGDQIETLDKLFFNSGLDADIYSSALAKLTGQTDKASKEQSRLAELLGATPTAKLEEARTDMELLASSLEAGHITEEQFVEATQARLGTLGHAVKEVDNFARDLGLTFASAFEDAAIGGKNLSDVIQGLGKDIERIILRETITEPMGKAISNMIKGNDSSSGGLLSGIKNLFGFASGGSFTVGGAGGTDSQLVAFKATPGEQVVVRTPGQQQSSGISIVQNISIDSRTDQAVIMQAMVQAKNAAVTEIRNSQRRGMS